MKANYRHFKAAATLGLGGIALVAGAACSGGTGGESVANSGQASTSSLNEMGFKPLCAELTGLVMNRVFPVAPLLLGLVREAINEDALPVRPSEYVLDAEIPPDGSALLAILPSV